MVIFKSININNNGVFLKKGLFPGANLNVKKTCNFRTTYTSSIFFYFNLFMF